MAQERHGYHRRFRRLRSRRAHGLPDGVGRVSAPGNIFVASPGASPVVSRPCSDPQVWARLSADWAPGHCPAHRPPREPAAQPRDLSTCAVGLAHHGETWRMRWVWRAEHGGFKVEYGALILLVATIVTAVFAFGMPTRVQEFYVAAMCRIDPEREDCEPYGGGPGTDDGSQDDSQDTEGCSTARTSIPSAPSQLPIQSETAPWLRRRPSVSHPPLPQHLPTRLTAVGATPANDHRTIRRRKRLTASRTRSPNSCPMQL